MNEYKKSLWVSNLTVLLFAILATVICKLTFNEMLIQQQTVTATKVNEQIINRQLDGDLLTQLIDYNVFNYIKISPNKLSNPLIFENTNLSTMDALLGDIKATTFLSNNGSTLFEYKTKNNQLLALK